ncbi:gamma-carboxygeranoyl-CoA hydratase [Stutzerimonas degradans]|uniref:Gamma-carboxygeranoyl-CoA hydratase n=1 Tax=Stutzerimonas degradans TaxID=2968968 RepID=A0A8E2U0Z9_9GAMM|nr:gamma-carboxygeranoyl-CoA hydratase [Stutzerimonas degradans]MCQ4277287.1 gamma-carboxygeranoyl-CoA hydratase [Stutzerimonas degradans]PNF75986.1 gamma-carboxygeranoyl-CoA hydratase [Stutzerimonas degradans]QPT21680.1 gamma-carboxygeranoyl-CoA hydratase [Stutzerimonas degradans]
MTAFQTIELNKDARGVATLWLNRADKNNAFDARVIGELNTALAEMRDDASIRFLVLRGRGKHFSAGADLGWMRESAELDYQANLDDAHELGELMQRLHQLPQPTLAVVQGAAFGGALGLIACCDMAIGASDALFCLSEVRIGLAPAVISPFVVKAIGERAARRYALTAERFDGERARELGLLAETYPAEELDAALERWVDNLLLNSPQALRACKALLLEVGDGDYDAALRQTTEQAIARLRTSPEGQEGLSAFLEKRTPAWQESQP